MDINDTYHIIDYLDLDKSTTELIFSRDLFCKSEDYLVNLRLENQRALVAGRCKLVCGHCHEPIQIYGNLNQENTPGKQHYHFRHVRPELDNNEPCPYRSENEEFYDRDTLLREKYRGLPMNPEHDQIQDAIQYWLKKWDANTEKEKRINAIKPSREYRKADIYAEVNGKKIIFEVQRTSTSVGTIVGRDDFYRRRGMYIIWIITRPNDINCAKRDIFYDNAENFFVYDDEAKTMSYEIGELCLTCYFCEWMFDDNSQYTRCNELSKTTIPFSQLHFDENNFKIYYATPDDLKKNFIKELYKPYKRRLDEILEEEKKYERNNQLKKIYYSLLRGIPIREQPKAKMKAKLVFSSYLTEVFQQICSGNTSYNQKNFIELLQFVQEEYPISYQQVIESFVSYYEAFKNKYISADLFLYIVTLESFNGTEIEYNREQFIQDITDAELNSEKCCILYAFHAFTTNNNCEFYYGCIENELYKNWRFYAVLFSIALDRLNLRFRYSDWPSLLKYTFKQYPRKMQYVKKLIQWKANNDKTNNYSSSFLLDCISHMSICECNELYTNYICKAIFTKIY